MKIALPLIGLLVVTVGCSGQQAGVVGAGGGKSQKKEGASPEGFTTVVTLSDSAKKRLVESKETIVVAAYVSGTPKEGAPKRYVNEMGEVELGDATREIAPGEDAKFGRISLNKDALAQTDRKDPQLLINVYSGRKSSKDNLLWCSLYQGSLQAVQGDEVKISCKLIRE
jgi:hypothetical protein